jgi:hypothetical protein
VLDEWRLGEEVGHEASPLRMGRRAAEANGMVFERVPLEQQQVSGRAIAALTVPYAERIDQIQRKSIPEVTRALGLAARTLSKRIGGMVPAD